MSDIGTRPTGAQPRQSRATVLAVRPDQHAVRYANSNAVRIFGDPSISKISSNQQISRPASSQSSNTSTSNNDQISKSSSFDPNSYQKDVGMVDNESKDIKYM